MYREWDGAQGVTMYQADYSMAAVTLKAEGSPLQPAGGELFNLPLASLENQAGTVDLGP
jgi:hypothetical protein